MANSTSNTSSLKVPSGKSKLETTIRDLKVEFEEKFHKNRLAESGERLKEFKFMAILGSGAFGVVVSY